MLQRRLLLIGLLLAVSAACNCVEDEVDPRSGSNVPHEAPVVGPVLPFEEALVRVGDFSVRPGFVIERTSNGSDYIGPPRVLEGFCPVTLNRESKWVKGLTEHALLYEGRWCYFASVENQKAFEANPALFAPAAEGYDVVYRSLGQDRLGLRAFGVIFQARIYLFADERTRQTFEWDPERYVAPDGARRLQPVVAAP